MTAIPRTAICLVLVCAAATCVVQAMECIGGSGTKKCKAAGDCSAPGETCLELFRGQAGNNHFGVCGPPQGETCDCDPSLPNAVTCAGGLWCKATRCSKRGCAHECLAPTSDEIEEYLECKDEAGNQWQEVADVADLAAAIKRGAQLKVGTFLGLFRVQTAFVEADDSAVHAQALFFMPYVRFPFGDRAFNWYITVSTSGNFHYSVYYHGYSYADKPSNFQNRDLPRATKWFIRDAGVELGVSGPVTDFALSQRAADVRVVWGQTNRQLKSVSVGPSGITGQFIWHLQGGEKFTDDETFEFSDVSSAGVKTTSMLVDDETVLGEDTKPVSDATWFADTCWTESYSYDSTGAAVSGSLGDLVDDAMSGKPIMIRIDGTLHMASMVRVADDGSSVVAQVYDRMAADMSSPTWTWLSVSTDGSVTEISNAYGAAGASNIVTSTSAVTWYSQSRAWVETYSTDGSVGTLNALTAAYDAGKDVRYGIKRDGGTEISQADAVTNKGSYFLLFNDRGLDVGSSGVQEKRTFLLTTGSMREKMYNVQGKNVEDVTSSGVVASVWTN